MIEPVEAEKARAEVAAAESEVTPEFVKVKLPEEEVIDNPVEPVRETAVQFTPSDPKMFPAEVVAIEPTVVPPVKRLPEVSEVTPVPPYPTPIVAPFQVPDETVPDESILNFEVEATWKWRKSETKPVG